MPAGTAGIKAGKAFILIEAVDATGKILNSIRNKMGKFGTELSNIGRTMALRAIAALTPVAFAVKAGTSYDDIMRKVEARSEGTAAEMAALRKQTLELGRSLGLLPSGLGNIQNIFAQAGFNRAEIAKIAPAVATLARAGEGKDAFMNMDLAAKAVGSVLRGFDMDASKSAEVVDKLAIALNASNYNLEDITTSLQYAVPAAKFYNVSLEEMLVTLAAMRDLQIDASIAGTAFRNLGLYTSNTKAQEKFNALLQEATGNVIKFSDAGKNLHTPATLMVAMMKATSGLGTAERSNVISSILKARATIPGAAIGQSVNRMAEVSTRLQNFNGEATRIQKMMDSGLGGAFRRLAASVEVLSIKLADALGPVMLTIAEHADRLIQAVSSWTEANRGLAATISVSLVSFLALGTAFVVIGQGLILLQTSLGILFGPISMLVTALKAFDIIGTRGLGVLVRSVTMLGGVIQPVFLLMARGLGVVTGIFLRFAGIMLSGVIPAIFRLLGALRMIPTVLSMGVMVFQSLTNIGGVVFASLLSIIGPLGVVLLPIIALTAAVAVLYGWLKQFSFNPFEALGIAAKVTADTVKTELGGMVNTAWQWLKKLGEDLSTGWISSFKSISDSLASGDLTSAFKTLTVQLHLTWQELVNNLVTLWEEFIDSFNSGELGGSLFTKFMEFENRLSNAWGGQDIFSEDYIQSYRETLKGQRAELDRQNQTTRDSARQDRAEKLRGIKEQLDAQYGDARARAAIAANDAHDEALLREQLSRAPDAEAKRKEIEDAAAALIGPKGILPAVPKGANEAVDRTSSEAMKAFMENKYNVYGNEAVDLLGDIHGVLEDIRDGEGVGGV